MTLIPSKEQQDKWIQLAESLKPALIRTPLDPVSLVNAAADSNAFQGWRMQPVGEASSLAQRNLAKGEKFILDFGEHCVGYLNLQLDRHGSGDSPTRLRFTFGEVSAEVIEPFDTYQGWLSRAWLQDEVINIDVLPAVITLPRRYAFRYVKIEVVAMSGSLTVTQAWCDCVTTATAIKDVSPIPPHPMISHELRQIDRISLLTLRDCMQTVFEDGPKRDRRLWLGDLRLQAKANAVSFKNFDLVKRCLYLHAGLLREDGFVAACVYETPSPRLGADFIVDYAALFAATLLDYLNDSGDTATAMELSPVALLQAELLNRYVNKEGLFTNETGTWVFIDWNPKLDKDTAALGAIIFGLRQTVVLAERLGFERVIAPLRERLLNMSASAKRNLFDKDKGVFVSGLARQVSWASQAWLVLAGVVKGEDAMGILRAVANDPSAIKPASPYGWHYVAEAMNLCGMSAEALNIVCDYWGNMLRLGADTFWEVFDPTNQYLSPYGSHLVNSYCHAWSCTPTVFIRQLQP